MHISSKDSPFPIDLMIKRVVHVRQAPPRKCCSLYASPLMYGGQDPPLPIESERRTGSIHDVCGRAVHNCRQNARATNIPGAWLWLACKAGALLHPAPGGGGAGHQLTADSLTIRGNFARPKRLVLGSLETTRALLAIVLYFFRNTKHPAHHSKQDRINTDMTARRVRRRQGAPSI